MNGTEGPRAQATRAFLRNLAPLTDLPVVLWDERLSTAAAERAMLEADLSRKKRAEKIDAAAAAFILQGALDRLARLRAADASGKPRQKSPTSKSPPKSPPASAAASSPASGSICAGFAVFRPRPRRRRTVAQHVAEQDAAGHAHRGLRRAGEEAAAALPRAGPHGS